MSTLQAEPTHTVRVAAKILRAIAESVEEAGATQVHVDQLNAWAAILDKQAGTAA